MVASEKPCTRNRGIPWLNIITHYGILRAYRSTVRGFYGNTGVPMGIITLWGGERSH